jgi:hypothetical protein
MAARKSTTATIGTAIHVVELSHEETFCHILGSSPLIFNRMAEKAKRELLFPRGRKTAADKVSQLKHNPPEEYRASVYRNPDSSPTRLKFPASGFKRLLASAALEVPGAKKAQVGRLTWVSGEYIDIYGVPELRMDVVRSADIGKTPDIRTRACIRHWATKVPINYVTPTLNMQVIATLLAGGGLVIGIGDGRQEKGALSFGQFEIVNENDPRMLKIVETGTREIQDAALADPVLYDEDTSDLYHWWHEEVDRRGRAPVKSKDKNEAEEDDEEDEDDEDEVAE